MKNRRLVLALVRQKLSEIEVSRRVGRADPNSFLILLDCSFDIAGLSQRRSEIHTSWDAGRVGGDGFAKLICSFREPRGIEGHPATNQVKALSLDEFLQVVYKRISDSNTDRT